MLKNLFYDIFVIYHTDYYRDETTTTATTTTPPRKSLIKLAFDTDVTAGGANPLLGSVLMSTAYPEPKEAVIQVGVIVDIAGVFNFTMPEEVAGYAAGSDNIATASVTTTDGNSLPSWLSFNPRTQTFTAKNMPAGSLPVKVLVHYPGVSGNGSVVVTITELLHPSLAFLSRRVMDIRDFGVLSHE